MSYEQGLQIAKAREAFIKATTASGDLQMIDEFAARLRNNDSLNADDIDRAHGLLRKLRRATKFKINDSYNHVDAFSVNLGLFSVMPCETDPDMYIPAQTIVAIRPDMILNAHRQHPIAFASSAIEHCYLSQTSQPLDWNDENIYYLIMTGLKMSHLIRNKIIASGQTTCPVMLPHKDGLMFGHAALCLAETYDPHITAVSNKRGRKSLDQYHLVDEVTEMDFRPQVSIILHHFTDLSNLNPTQTALYDDYGDMLEDESVQTAVDALRDTYTVGIKPSPDYVAHVLNFEHQLKAILQSDIWRKATAILDVTSRRDLN